MIKPWPRYGITTAVLAALTATILYWPTLNLPILYDDLLHIRIVKGLDLATVWLPTEAFGFYRPLTFLPLLLIKGAFGHYPAWLLHSLNVAQHTLNAALLVLLSWRLWQRLSWAITTGLLFALFPFSYQAIAVYGHNVHPATTGLILLGLHTYLTAVKVQGSRFHPFGFAQGKVSRARKRLATIWWPLTGLLFLLALLSHESAILFGAFAALVHWQIKTVDNDDAPGEKSDFPDSNNNPILEKKPISRSLPENLKKPDFSGLSAGCYTRGAIVFQVKARLFRQAASAIATKILSPWFLFLILGGLYAILYQFLPISRTPQAAVVPGDFSLKALYLLQAAAYPFTWFAHQLPDISARTIIVVGTALTVGLTTWTAARRQNRWPLLLGWGWFGLAALLIALPLPAEYLLHGPRLLYLGSVGLALLWPVLLDPLYRRLPYGRIAWTILVAFILVTNWLFVRDRLHAYDQLTGPVNVVAGVMVKRPPSEGIVLVNLPQWLAPSRNVYPAGAEFVAMLGDYLFVEELMAENLGVDRPVWALKLPELLSDPGYGYGVHDQTAAALLESNWATAGSHVFITHYTTEGIRTGYTGYFSTAAAQSSLATFGPYGVVAVEAAHCRQTVQTSLSWQIPGNSPIAPSISIFVQALGDDGRLLAQADGPPLGLRPDRVYLAPGWQIVDQRVLHLNASDSDQPAHLLVGAYDYTSGTRLPAQDGEGRPLGDNAAVFPITGCPD